MITTIGIHCRGGVLWALSRHQGPTSYHGADVGASLKPASIAGPDHLDVFDRCRESAHCNYLQSDLPLPISHPVVPIHLADDLALKLLEHLSRLCATTAAS